MVIELTSPAEFLENSGLDQIGSTALQRRTTVTLHFYNPRTRMSSKPGIREFSKHKSKPVINSRVD